MRLNLGFGVLVAVALFAAGCDMGRKPATKVSPPPTGEPSEGIKVGNRAPEITGQDADGVNFKLSDYRGKVVLLDFWFEH